jgi:IclR family acetate operon transcriptional repressor
MSHAGRPLSENQRIESVQQAAKLLGLFQPEVPELTLKEMAAGVGIKEATASKVVANLEHAGLLERGRMGGYRLGRRLWRMGLQTLRNREVWDEARPILDRLSAETGLSGLIAVYHDGEAIYVEQIRANRREALGRAVPAHATALGKVLLAHLPTDELRRAISERGLVGLTEHTITDAPALDRELAEIRSVGYAVEDEEYQRGHRSLAAPVHDHSGQVVAALGLGELAHLIPARRVRELGSRLVEAGQELSRRLGAGEEAALAPVRLRVKRREGPRDPQAIISREPTEPMPASGAVVADPAHEPVKQP